MNTAQQNTIAAINTAAAALGLALEAPEAVGSYFYQITLSVDEIFLVATDGTYSHEGYARESWRDESELNQWIIFRSDQQPTAENINFALGVREAAAPASLGWSKAEADALAAAACRCGDCGSELEQDLSGSWCQRCKDTAEAAEYVTTYEALEAHIARTYPEGSDTHTEALIYLGKLKAEGVAEGAALAARWF